MCYHILLKFHMPTISEVWSRYFLACFSFGSCYFVLHKLRILTGSNFKTKITLLCFPTGSYFELINLSRGSTYIVCPGSHSAIDMTLIYASSYLCPISCATVNPTARPLSSLMLQLRFLLHMPDTWANPNVKQISEPRHRSFLQRKFNDYKFIIEPFKLFSNYI